jgi:3-(3-hydroxy-phenyl)propionate hydroxylase
MTARSGSTANPPVLVVGGGPVGLTTANLLAARDVPVVLVERNSSTSDDPKAISLDDESLRALAAADLADSVRDIVVPGTGTRYFDRHARPLFHARGPRAEPLGYPFKNQFAQPELERLLLAALRSRPDADARFATELVSLADEADSVVATLRSSDGTETYELRASWILAADGGRSRIRELRGLPMTGTSHQEVWLVVDTVGDQHDQRYGMHFGTPGRPTVVVPGRDGRCRYEFLLRQGEGTRTSQPDFATIRRLLAPYRMIDEDQVERSTAYTFHGLVADRWRDGRCLLLGDAAHMMPPFAGQGLNSGLRDSANLAWKIEHVWRGWAADRLLDTYEAERRPHAAAMVQFSERLGKVVMTTSRPRAAIRDLATRAVLAAPPGRRYLTEMRFRPAARQRAGVVLGNHPLVGRMLPQPWVLRAPRLRTHRLDEVLGKQWALLGVDVDESAWRHFAERVWHGLDISLQRVDIVLGDHLPIARAGREAVADADGQLDAALATARHRLVLVKPDRYVAAVVDPGDITAVDRLASAIRIVLGRPAVQPAARTASWRRQNRSLTG